MEIDMNQEYKIECPTHKMNFVEKPTDGCPLCEERAKKNIKKHIEKERFTDTSIPTGLEYL